MEEEKTEYCIETKEQAADFAKQVLEEWRTSFNTGLDPVYTDTENYEKLGWRTDWDIFKDTTLLFSSLISGDYLDFMNFEFPTDKTFLNEATYYNGEGFSKRFSYDCSWTMLKSGNARNNCLSGTLTLKPQIEMRLKTKSSKEITYLLSMFGSFQCKDFMKKHKCSTKKTVRLGQTLSVSDFWLYMRSNCFYVYELLLDDAYMFSLSKKEN